MEVQTVETCEPAPQDEKELERRVLDRMERLLIEGSEEPVNLKQTGQLPPWYDSKKFKKGQEFFHRNYFALFVSKLAGLILLLSNQNMLRVLKLTNKSSNKLTAFKRYMGTIRHMLSWYDGDLQTSGSSAHMSLMTVRGFHCAASNKAASVGFGHISQRDMAFTQFGFMGFSLLKFDILGLVGTPEEIEGFIHFWRTIGYLLGISDEYNLCGGSIEETRELCRILLEQNFVPDLEKNPPDFVEMSTALMEGMRAVIPAVDKYAFLGFTYFLCGLEFKQLLVTFLSRCICYYHIFCHKLLSTPCLHIVFRPCFNYLVRLGIYCVEKFPSITFFYFGQKINWKDDDLTNLKLVH
nr:PREDICTED: uncharacterized protein LOC109038734 [Bemisia tabaci]